MKLSDVAAKLDKISLDLDAIKAAGTGVPDGSVVVPQSDIDNLDAQAGTVQAKADALATPPASAAALGVGVLAFDARPRRAGSQGTPTPVPDPAAAKPFGSV